MDRKRAAEVLRSIIWRKSTHVVKACEMGAEALEAWAWVERATGDVSWSWCTRSGRLLSGTGYKHPTPLAAVLDAMEKEGKG
jgi:hypothetical protein